MADRRSNNRFDTRTVGKLLRLLKGDVAFIILALLISLVSIVASLYINVLIGRAIDCMVSEGNVDFAGVRNSCVIIAVCVVISAVFAYVSKMILDRIAFKTVKRFRDSLFGKIQRVSVSYIDSHTPGDMISRLINDIEQISDGMILSFAELFSGVVTIAGTLVFMFMLDWRITLIVLFATPFTLLVARFIANSTYKYFTRQTKDNASLTSAVEESITGISVLRAFSMEDRRRALLKEEGERLKKSSTSATFFSSTVMPTTRIINGIIYAAVGVAGALTVIKNGSVPGGLTVGLLSSFLAYATKFSTPFNDISGVMAEFQGAVAGAKRVFDVLETHDETDPEDSLDDVESKGGVLIENVDFSYDKNVPLIKNFNLEAKPGQRVAIVGPTGCGKTTFINLLMRFYDVDAGSISIDGTDVRNITRDCVHRNYGMVLQETWLRSGTVRDNIAMGRPGATDEEIEQAAKLAHAHSFIVKLPDGYNTEVSNELAGLSYGQKQLICIARLMLTSPPMLILDEATSSIDTRTEIKVQSGFKKLMRGRTSFIVAHRLSTIKNCDLIVVMRDGKIEEQGTHEELLGHEGFYKELYESQNN
ncbi:MAG: ABC transporter ATP-binding protein [Clostridia bacterium]|nr:ABC transporter ATP-binding protein [Clostridia bacterium]MBO7504109.1 ABC transporter ATP-binding protein [Clostridia bacterium]